MESTGYDAEVRMTVDGFELFWPGGNRVVNRVFADKVYAQCWLDGYYFAKDGG